MVSKPKSKEYFSERAYGVKASPRVSTKRSRLPRGGGRDQIGKPYMVKGKWYYPKEDKSYAKVGAASWYGDAFHGRLTANGEVYDMTHLTAAHPTMPLPSYARVTNVKNGTSVIVRVNDRGPFAHDRVIDLSKRAAEMLDYAQSGVAQVKVEYVGRAPLEGQDDSYLLASYRPGNGPAADPINDGLPDGVLIAVNGNTPSDSRAQQTVAAAFPGTLTTSTPPETAPVLVAAAQGGLPAEIELPAAGPIVPERPAETLAAAPTAKAPPALSYADHRVARAAEAVSAFAGEALSPAEIAAALANRAEASAPVLSTGAFIAVGTYATRGEADRQAAVFSGKGAVTVAADSGAYTVSLRADGNQTFDALLQFAWTHGAPEALPVRD